MKKILVFGSFNYDMTARVARFPGPGETVLGLPLLTGPGGKGCNQAIAAHRAGGRVSFVTKVGRDVFGDTALRTCEGVGLAVEGILRDENYPTGSASIILEQTGGQNMIVVNEGACGHFTASDVDGIFARFSDAEILLAQLETNLDALAEVIRRAKAANMFVILNPAPAAQLDGPLYAATDLITPNESETELLTGIPIRTAADADRAAAVFFSRGVRQVIITLGKAGVYVNDGVRSACLPAHTVKAVDTTGAGDCFNGALAAALSEGKDLMTAAAFANAAAALSVTRLGAGLSAPTRDEILALL